MYLHFENAKISKKLKKVINICEQVMNILQKNDKKCDKMTHL